MIITVNILSGDRVSTPTPPSPQKKKGIWNITTVTFLKKELGSKQIVKS